MTPQKRALQAIQETGQAPSAATSTLASLERKGHIRTKGAGWELTKRGASYLDGKLGNAANLSRMWNKKDREASLAGAKQRKAGGKIARTRKTKAADRKGFESELKRDAARHKKNLERVLGPSGLAGGVKVSKANGKSFKAADVEAFLASGWGVMAAGSVAARPGAGPLPGSDGRDFIFTNPEPLGPNGTARALILVGSVDAETVGALQMDGLDVSAAPRGIKEGKTRNPGGYGDHGPEERAALKKARAFYGDDSLVTQPKPLRGYVAPNAAVEIGELVAIEYDSNKFDGEPRIYRHDVTKKRKMFISIDGSTIIIQPPLKVTKRGIEG